MNPDTFVDRLRAVQNQTTATPWRGNGRMWWASVYQKMRTDRLTLKHPNTPSLSVIFTANRSALVYGPCGKLP